MGLIHIWVNRVLLRCVALVRSYCPRFLVGYHRYECTRLVLSHFGGLLTWSRLLFGPGDHGHPYPSSDHCNTITGALVELDRLPCNKMNFCMPVCCVEVMQYVCLCSHSHQGLRRWLCWLRFISIRTCTGLGMPRLRMRWWKFSSRQPEQSPVNNQGMVHCSANELITY